MKFCPWLFLYFKREDRDIWNQNEYFSKMIFTLKYDILVAYTIINILIIRIFFELKVFILY